MFTVDYQFYASSYHGSLPEQEFQRYGVYAGAYLEDLTSGRVLNPMPEDALCKVQLAYCALCDALSKEERAEVASETNDGISVTYAAPKGDREQRLRNAVVTFLSGTGLLYRGVQ